MKLLLAASLVAVTSITPLASAALLYHLDFDGATPGENSGSAGAIPWGSAPDVAGLVPSFSGMGNAFHTSAVRPWTTNLGQASWTFEEGTISFWTTGGGAAWRDYFSFGAVGSNLKLERTNTGTLALYDVGGPVPGFSAMVSATILAADEWHLVTLTYSTAANEAVLYVDGAAEASIPWAGPSTVIGQFQIGSQLGDSGRAITTTIDDLRIYDSALSSLQVAALVPEPSTALLGALGALGLLRRRR